MRAFDFSPLARSTVGFERMFDLLDRASRAEPAGHWPAYDISKTGENSYRITLAVAGFGPEDIDIVQEGPSLVVSGRKQDSGDESRFLHRGIAGRSFRQSFDLAAHVSVSGATLDHGILTVNLVREVPEAAKPRRIPIGQAAPVAQVTRGEPVAQDNAPTPEERSARAA
jgi:molecular chaperone IbpA